MAGALTVLSPVAGMVRDLAGVPDEVFATGIVGPGVAIEPADGCVVAPVSGTVVALRSHALVVRADWGGVRDVLVHLGVDTFGAIGAGYRPAVRYGAYVVAGETVLEWDPAVVEAAGFATVCPVVALRADPRTVHLLVTDGMSIRAGAPILSWA